MSADRKLDAAVDRWLDPPNNDIPNMEFEFDFEGYPIIVTIDDGRAIIQMYVSALYEKTDVIEIEKPSCKLVAAVDEKIAEILGDD